MVEQNRGQHDAAEWKAHRPSPKEVVVGVAIATAELVKGVVHFLPHALETRPERDAAQIRKEYKLAMLKPYFKDLPMGVIEVMLDLDLNRIGKDRRGRIIPGAQDKHGRPISLYEARLAHGEVQEIIDI